MAKGRLLLDAVPTVVCGVPCSPLGAGPGPGWAATSSASPERERAPCRGWGDGGTGAVHAQVLTLQSTEEATGSETSSGLGGTGGFIAETTWSSKQNPLTCSQVQRLPHNEFGWWVLRCECG